MRYNKTCSNCGATVIKVAQSGNQKLMGCYQCGTLKDLENLSQTTEKAENNAIPIQLNLRFPDD